MTATAGRILLVDDEINTLKVLSAILKDSGYDVATARTAEEGLDKASKGPFDAAITDYRLPGINGLMLLQELRKKQPDIPVVMLTAFGSIEMAVEAMKIGAFNYISKPVNPDELLTVMREAVAKHSLLMENISLKLQLKDRYNFKNIIGKSDIMRELFSLIETVAASSSNVLITGESGTGKELVAKAIHYESPRSDKPFMPIDCTSLPEQLLESELFGHERGAFTGAHERKAGQIEYADGGTVFLDEVGELPLSVQKKFLRFLQEREFLRVGGSNRIKVDVRIISATNRNLDQEVRKGNFREDLFFRLNVIRIHVPPLRERKEDIPMLAAHFLSKCASANAKTISSIDSDVIEAFLGYDWPGNVRELENTIERAVVLCPSPTITIPFLPRAIRDIKAARAGFGEGLNLIETEKRLIMRALEKTSWNQTKASEALGISRKQLRTKMKHHGLLPEE
ncbi:MAG TPA: sigma-54 dependent transcriptional regulator [Dissulfurispiraceae bacterium]|nr:sigma-54 dependent transcriptional regulator [Dissulfurispiraceae bacterium]